MSTLLYADDATILIRGTNCDKIMSDAKIVLERAEEWCIANQLCLNGKKTIEALFSLKIHTFNNPQSIKFLGVSIEPPDLTFRKHIRDIGSRVSKNIFLLSRISNDVTSQVTRSAYFALVHSLIAYAIVAWGAFPESNYLFALQRRAVRILDGLNYRSDCRNAFTKLQILTLPSVYILECVLYGLENCGAFRTHAEVHQHNTRNRDKLYVDYNRLTKTQKGPLHMSQLFLNKLPPEARGMPKNDLKISLKRFLMKKAFYNVNEFLNCKCSVL